MVRARDVAPRLTVDVRDGDAATIADYARIPIAFEDREVLDCAVIGGAGVIRSSRRLENPYIKDYGGIAGENPAEWPTRFSGAQWRLLFAYVDGVHAGGALVVIEPR